MVDAEKGSVNKKDFEGFEKKKRKTEAEGFELIKQFVEKYPDTKYPTVDDDLVELFMDGARALGFNHIVCVGDDTICPTCKEKNKAVEKKGLALDALIGNNVVCNYCWVIEWQDKEWHDTETCDHKKYDKDVSWDKNCECWTYEDCMSVLESYEHSYKAVMEIEAWL